MSTIRLERLENPNTSNGGIDIDSSGNIGINTASFSAVSGISGAKLQSIGGVIVGNDGAASNGSGWLAFDSACNAPTSAKPVIYHRQGVGLGIRSDYQISFEIGSSDAVKIDDQQRLLIGTPTSTYNNAKVQIAGTNSTNYLSLLNTSTSDTDGNRWSYIHFRGRQSGGEESSLATVHAVHDGNSDDQKGRLIFSTNDGNDGNSPTERMRITSSGEIQIGSSTVQKISGVTVSNWGYDTAGNGTLVFVNLGTAGNGAYQGVGLGKSSTSWGTYSDERGKTALVPIENGLSKISTLRAVTGRYTEEEEDVSRSFLIAQDVQAVLPEAVDADNPEKLNLRYTEVIPLLVAALKESKERIETLEAKVAVLEGN